MVKNMEEKTDWEAVFRLLDEAGVPEDFLEDRDLTPPPERTLWREDEGVSPASSGGI